jgi:hypothetical protein
MEKGGHMEEESVDGRMISIRYLIKSVRVENREE